MLRERSSVSSLSRKDNYSKQAVWDGLHTQLEEMSSVSVHRKCVDKYCHKKTIQKALREGAQSPCSEDLVSKPKRARRSVQPKFSFLQHCLKDVMLRKILSIQADGVLPMSAGKEKAEG